MNLVLYGLTVLVWGSTWLAIEFQLGIVPPEVSIFYRYSAASLLLFGWCALRGERLAFPAAAHGWFAGLGVLLFGLNYVLAYNAQVHISSALTAIAFSTMLWMNILNARLFFGQRAGRGVLLGSVFGVAGILLLFYPQVGRLSWSDETVWGATLCVGSALVASLGNMVSQGAQRRSLPVLQSNAWGMFYGALLTGGYAAARGSEFAFDLSPAYLVSLAYLVVFGSIVAFGAYLTLLGRIGAHRAGYAMVMFPVVALILAVAVEGLRVSDSLVAGVLLVLTGNLFVLRRGRRSPAAPAVAPEADACQGARG
ncbi:MAG: EamA family transporter [Gammaproteobacteria bacterium]|nr:EamA family transporter [Gammaproteobacteria bacterium]MDH4255578.1 EamA family transporter [Gammaproteobacteria bacterium]MDH5311569.1 EamA family transporter [Gammaproteobacteria bacterium]